VSRSPLLIGVTELRRRPGTQREVEVAAPVEGLAITTARVPEGAEVEVVGLLEAIEGAITLTGTVRAPWVAECRRCLEDVTGLAEVEVREVFEARPTPGETYPIDGDDIDLEPVVRDTVLLHLPLAPLCREDCRGPVPEAIPVQPADPEHEGDAGAEPARDPRWAALDVLRDDADH
jgi:uncharacterized protein